MKIIGHRGARGLAPENTVASLLKAIQHSVDEIECDLHVTSDHIPVLCHNAWIADASGHKVSVADTTLAELRTHKPDLATMEEAIKAVRRRVPIVFEIKEYAELAPIIAVLRKHLQKDSEPEDFLIAAFENHTLKVMHQALPGLQKVINERWSGVRATTRARRYGTKRIAMKHTWLWNGFIRSLRRGGYELSAYTLNDPLKAQKWAKAGLSGVITDYPDRFEHRSRKQA